VRVAHGYAQCISFYFHNGGGRAATIALISRFGLAAKLDFAAINVNNLAGFL